MAFFTGSSIFDILTNQYVPNTGATPLDTTHTFTVNGVNLGQVEVLNFYGDQTVSTSNVDTTYFPDVTSAQDDIMCIRVFHGNLTIDNGVTFRPPHRTKGMFVLVKGDLTIGNNASISMTGRGSSAAGSSVRMWGTADIPAAGGSGANSATITFNSTTNQSMGLGVVKQNGNQGLNATSRGTGGGGSGAIHGLSSSSSNVTFTSGSGSAGTSWSGGNGGGGIAAGVNSTTQRSAYNATSLKGGAGFAFRASSVQTTRRAGGGAGITAGDGKFTGSGQTTGTSAESSSNNTGTGGLLMVACLRNVTFTNTNSKLTAQGLGDGGLSFLNNQNQFIAPGGSSGGGSVNLIYKNSSNTNIETTYLSAAGGASVSAAGSASDGANPYTSLLSGAGGNGSVTANTFSAENVTIPRRSLFKVGTFYYYRNFTSNTWEIATGNDTEPFERYGMFDAEVYALDREMITFISSINMSSVTLEVYEVV